MVNMHNSCYTQTHATVTKHMLRCESTRATDTKHMFTASISFLGPSEAKRGHDTTPDKQAQHPLKVFEERVAARPGQGNHLGKQNVVLIPTAARESHGAIEVPLLRTCSPGKMEFPSSSGRRRTREGKGKTWR